MSHHKVTVEGEGFTAEVKAPQEGSSGEWTAKVRLEDDGQRGKNVVLAANSAEELAGRLGELASAFSQTQAKVQELARPQVDSEPRVVGEQPQW